MNAYGSIDYKQPFGKQYDFRTSSYIAHFQRDEQYPIKPTPPLANVCTRFIPIGDEEPRAQSEQQSQYIFKAPDPNASRNPTIGKTHFMKQFDECYLRHAPKPLPHPSSTTFRDYNWKVIIPEAEKKDVYMPAAVAHNNIMQINRIKPGYAKYLDSSATINNTTHVAFPLHDLGIGTKDQITFYNWKREKYNVFKTKETQCEKYASEACPKRRREFQSTVKAVPNGGVTSEFTSSFGTLRSGLLLDLSSIKPKLVSYSTPLLKLESSNSIYGGGKRTESYL